MSGDNEEEFVPEDPSYAEASEGEGGEEAILHIKKLKERLKKATEEKQKNLDGWQRAQADFVNYKKDEAALRSEREMRAKAEFVESLLPALDSFELALKHAQTKEMNLVHKQLLDALRSLGVEFYGKSGEQFDPHRYEALREVPAKQPEDDHKVVSVERSGYSMSDYIIRPAQVTIGIYHG